MAAVGERQISYDARGLAEPVADAPRTAVVEDGVATFDAHDLTTRTINLELRRLLYEEGVDEVVALASEEIAIRAVLDREIETYDPYESEVFVWQR